MAKTGELETDIELLIQNVARMYAAEGNARLVALLAYSEVSAKQTGFNSWNGGVYDYTVFVEIEHSLYAQIRQDTAEIATELENKLNIFMHSYDDAQIEKILISPQLINSSTWQDDAKGWLAGEGINNQGRVRSDNMPVVSVMVCCLGLNQR